MIEMIELIERPVIPADAEDEAPEEAPVERQLRTLDGAPRVRSPKPLLRGWIHAAASLAALLVVVTFIVRNGSMDRRLPLIIFGASLVELFAVSAAFHILRWRGTLHRYVRLLDHSSIFVMIAATTTTFAALEPLAQVRLMLIVSIWSAAAGGIAAKTLYRGMSRTLSTWLYLAMGWCCGGVWVALWLFPGSAAQTRMTMSALLLPLPLAAVLYTLGALIYLRQAPNWWPKVFGYHELFHLLVVLANATVTIAVFQANGMLAAFVR
jgi:hemolysin III